MASQSVRVMVASQVFKGYRSRHHGPAVLVGGRLRTGLSLYRQLVYAFQKAIVSGQLLPADRFPSIRKLSQELRINPNTAQKVVTRLVDQRLLEVTPGVGTMVAHLPEASTRERSALLNHKAEVLVVEAKRLSLTLEQLLEAIQEHWSGLAQPSGGSESR